MSSRLLSFHSRSAEAERGSELVELAIVLPIFIILIMGIIDFGFMFQRYEILVNAAREGARLAVVKTHSNTGVQTRVAGYLTDAGLANAGSAQINVGDTSVTINSVVVPTKTVTVTYPSSFIFLPGSVNLQAVSTMRVEGGS